MKDDENHTYIVSNFEASRLVTLRDPRVTFSKERSVGGNTSVSMTPEVAKELLTPAPKHFGLSEWGEGMVD